MAVPAPESTHADADADMSMLIRALGETNRRLEDLTAGEVDTVTDHSGRSFLLQCAQERWRQSVVDKQTAIINTLPAHIALLDAEGVIVSVNAGWRRFGDENALRDHEYWVGRSYVQVCDRAGEAEASAAGAGIRSVLAGASKSFSLEYRCDSPTHQRWFQLTATPLDERVPMGAVIMHVDISARKSHEAELSRFAAAMDASPDAIFVIDRAEMRVVYVNQAACLMHNKPRDQMMATRPWENLNISRAAAENVYDAIILRGGFEEPVEHLLKSDGAEIWTEVRRHAQCIDGRWTIVALVRDITARRAAEASIRHLTRVYAVLSGINALIVRAGSRDEILKGACSIAVEQGALAMAWIGMLDKSLNCVTPCASAGMSAEYLTAITEQSYSIPLGRPDGSLPMRIISDKKVFVSNDSQRDPNVHLHALHVKYGINSIAKVPLIVADEAVGVLVLYAREKDFFHAQQLQLLTELTGNVAYAIQQVEKQERLDFLAYYDVITGLANRALFLERAAQYVYSAEGSGHKLAMCLIDLERFKNINDSLGRAAGDSLLKQVADWLTSNVGDSNVVARIDADRFAFMMPNVADEEDAARRLDNAIQAFMKHSFVVNDTGYRIAAKFGVALYPDDAGDSDTLFKHAEVALKKAKVGGDRYLFYARKMTETVVGRLNLENQLRRALEREEFVLHYQPKVNVVSGSLVGAEALIRWNDPQTGLVPPGRFIPILEETGLIQEVGRWALNQAMRDYLRWRKAGLPVVRVAVNLSPLQLRHRNFIADMRDVVGVAANAAVGLELEITESVIMEDTKLSITNLKAVRAMGVRVAIDDFGTGFSSLSYLSKLPVDSVKIDRSFITDMVAGPEGLSLVSIIINLAHSLKLKVVAEGVETEEQARLLRLLGCDEMQGFLIAKALPGEMFADQFLTLNVH